MRIQDGEREFTVSVWGRPQIISVYQKSKSVWIARGDYMGQSLEVKDRTESSAISAWRKAATYRGN
jgi:hypothetical protein